MKATAPLSSNADSEHETNRTMLWRPFCVNYESTLEYFAYGGSVSKRNQVRIVMLIPAFILGGFIFSFVHTGWINFWLAKDPGQTQARIINELSHGVVAYKYTVNNTEYSGQSQRSRDKNEAAHVGEEAPVIFSISHPWLSSLQQPVFPVGGIWGILMLVITLLIESMLIATIINPKGRWSFNTGLRGNE